jgi:hypothetical protein
MCTILADQLNSLLGNKIGATSVQVYNAKHSQLEITFTHIDASLAFSVFSVEFGLQQQKHRFVLL